VQPLGHTRRYVTLDLEARVVAEAMDQRRSVQVRHRRQPQRGA
jgi:hypothetical protein